MIKSLFTFTSATLIAGQVLAGAGGYFSETCVSSSGRTIITTLFSDSSKTQVNLVIDGVSKKYENEVDGISIVTGNDTLAVINKDGTPLLSLTGSNQNLSSQLFVDKSADPRKGSVIDYHASATDLSVKLKCTAYTKEP